MKRDERRSRGGSSINADGVQTTTLLQIPSYCPSPFVTLRLSDTSPKTGEELAAACRLRRGSATRNPLLCRNFVFRFNRTSCA